VQIVERDKEMQQLRERLINCQRREEVQIKLKKKRVET
jgi:hypothetical protein